MSRRPVVATDRLVRHLTILDLNVEAIGRAPSVDVCRYCPVTVLCEPCSLLISSSGLRTRILSAMGFRDSLFRAGRMSTLPTKPRRYRTA